MKRAKQNKKTDEQLNPEMVIKIREISPKYTNRSVTGTPWPYNTVYTAIAQNEQTAEDPVHAQAAARV